MSPDGVGVATAGQIWLIEGHMEKLMSPVGGRVATKRRYVNVPLRGGAAASAALKS